jgi:hypothetical protein
MHKNATKCNKTQSKWCINKHGASKIIDTFETYQGVSSPPSPYIKAPLGGELDTRGLRELLGRALLSSSCATPLPLSLSLPL